VISPTLLATVKTHCGQRWITES